MDAQENTLYITILIAGLLIGSIILLFIISILKHQKRNNEAHDLKVKTEIATLERERSRMSIDFHDEIGPLLSAVKFKIASIDITNEEDSVIIDELYEHLDMILQSMREVSGNLMPFALEWGGLFAAISQFLNSTCKETGLQIAFENPQEFSIPREMSIHIYRIIQEITNNTIKHAGASRLSIQFNLQPGKIILSCKDNGKGFKQAQYAKESQGLGLRSILSRTEILHAELEVDSKPGAGTSYTFEIPFPSNDEKN